jgi:hypothetical protein
MEAALADLWSKHDRTPENSAISRQELARMAQALQAEIAERNARVAAS